MRITERFKNKRSAKQQREYEVLIGVIEHFLKTGKPVGSNTLKEAEFQGLSSATIRNYFANLEKEGYLNQQHASGGRIPTAKAFKLYASEVALQNSKPSQEIKHKFASLKNPTSKEINLFVQSGAEILSQIVHLPVFMSAPRFDHDYLLNIKVVLIDNYRCLCVLITNFGLIRTEIMHSKKKLTSFSAKRIESYFQWRLTNKEKPLNLEPDEEDIAQKFYNEVIVRYIVGYAHFVEEDIYRTGFSQLLSYPEFDSPISIAQGLSLFENKHSMTLLLKETEKTNRLRWWIGDDLLRHAATEACSVIAYPYYVNQTPVGAIGLLGPVRVPYKQLFDILKQFSEDISNGLTRSVYKYQLTYRKPQDGAMWIEQEEKTLMSQSYPMLLEDKRENT
ncbi:MAG: heat-inducible transcriptional repressor HrcA [Chlamydiales bacterium]